MRGPRHQLADALEGVELLGLGVELHGQRHAVAGRDVSCLAEARRRLAGIAATPIHRTHHGARAEGPGPLALLGEDLVEPRALGAARPHPAQLDPDAGDRQPARFHQVHHLRRRLATFSGSHEVDAA